MNTNNISAINQEKINSMLSANGEVDYPVWTRTHLPSDYLFLLDGEKEFQAGHPAWITRWDSSYDAILVKPEPQSGIHSPITLGPIYIGSETITYHFGHVYIDIGEKLINISVIEGSEKFHCGKEWAEKYAKTLAKRFHIPMDKFWGEFVRAL